MAKRWEDAARPCKLGTIPFLVHLDGRSTLAVGKWVRVQDCNGGRWFKVLVTKVYPDGYFMADK